MNDLAKPSLRTRVLQHVMLPLALTWFAGTVVAVAVANYFTQQAFDRALLDDAYSVAANVRHEPDGRLELTLSPREVGAVLFDQSETVFFAVTRRDGSLVAGHPGLVVPRAQGNAPFEFSDITYEGREMRAVTLRARGDPGFDVVMAQTTQSRNVLLRRLLAFSIPPQLLLLLLLAWWLRRSIEEDLQPLGQLQLAMDQRDALDLTPVEVSATTRDTQRLGTAFNSLLERIDHSIRAQREFAGNVAHELRTPLAGIRALAEYGLAQKSPQAWREQLQKISASEERASHLISQLLGLALADEAGSSVELAPLQLDELVRSVVLRAMDRADQLGVDLGARGLEEPVVVRANAALVEGILGNLIDNALRYGRRPGSAVASVTVEIERGGGKVMLHVIDDGPGIEEAERLRLMQRWAQGRSGERLGQGAGLGLAIVARYAQLLGAKLVLSRGAGGQGFRAGVELDELPAAT